MRQPIVSRMRAATIAAVALCMAMFLVPAAHAQGPNPQRPTRFEPYRPRFSPYLDYFRRDTGLLDQYNAFIVPRRRLDQTIRQQQGNLNTLQGEVRRLEQQSTESMATPTGKGAGFMNYLHYYPSARR